ncbi:hypothetical protein [Zavarzinia sp.]|uniref:hypothetical protein n=1 Tax=Zavarzinia sp. TaxID=2027920 RepID=UPI0035624AA1
MTRLRRKLSAPAALFAAGLTCALAGPAAAVQVDVGQGQSLELAPPAGYCALDEARPPEANLIRAMRGAVGETMRVVLAFGDCGELVELRDGKRPLLDHFGQILLVAQGDKVQRIPETRANYLAAVAKPMPSATVADIAANGEAQMKAGKPSDRPKPIFAVLGRDELALYIGTTSLQGEGDEKTLVAGLAGVTLVHQIPVNINIFGAYAGDKASGAAALDRLVEQMTAAISDLQFTNDDVDMPAPLPVPSRNEWRAMGSTALVGAVVGGLLGGIGALALVWLRRRRRAAQDDAVHLDETPPSAEPPAAEA